mmetsp:Transcript_16482/g.46818  ORF Transcript_16482/g.46818 Transcript_16482/m.46818 type:complete len:251 (-) Transcript_16482:1283-2035(-)
MVATSGSSDMQDSSMGFSGVSLPYAQDERCTNTSAAAGSLAARCVSSLSPVAVEASSAMASTSFGSLRVFASLRALLAFERLPAPPPAAAATAGVGNAESSKEGSSSHARDMRMASKSSQLTAFLPRQLLPSVGDARAAAPSCRSASCLARPSSLGVSSSLEVELESVGNGKPFNNCASFGALRLSERRSASALTHSRKRSAQPPICSNDTARVVLARDCAEKSFTRGSAHTAATLKNSLTSVRSAPSEQ